MIFIAICLQKGLDPMWPTPSELGQSSDVFYNVTKKMYIYTVCQLFIIKTNHSWFWLFVPYEGATHPVMTTSKKYVRNFPRSYNDTRKYSIYTKAYIHVLLRHTYILQKSANSECEKKVLRCQGHCKMFSLCLPQLRKVIIFWWFCIPQCQHFLWDDSSVSTFPPRLIPRCQHFLWDDSSVSTFPPRLIPRCQHFPWGWFFSVNISPEVDS
jgi:hypothetical protein